MCVHTVLFVKLPNICWALMVHGCLSAKPLAATAGSFTQESKAEFQCSLSEISCLICNLLPMLSAKITWDAAQVQLDVTSQRANTGLFCTLPLTQNVRCSTEVMRWDLS